MSSTLIVDGQLVLHGPIGLDWYGDGITAAGVVQALAEIGRGNPVTVRLNSGGGIATEGEAIRAALAAHGGEVSVRVEGIAASAASIVAMGAARGRLAMSPGAVMMIHDPSAFTVGTAADHQKSIAALDAIGNAMAGVYAARTGRTSKAERQRMTDETWMTAENAVAQGYADAVDGGAAPAEPTAFNYGLYARAPERFVAMAKANGWTRFGGFANPQPPDATAAQSRGEAAQPHGRKETTMKTEAEIRADLQSEFDAKLETARKEAVDAAAKAATDATAAALKAEQDRAAEIRSLCDLAGFPSRAGAMIAEGKTVAQAREDLTKAKAENPAGEINPRRPAGRDDKPAVSWADVHAKVAKDRGAGRAA